MQVEPFVTAIELAAATVYTVLYTWVASVVSKNTHKNVDKYSITQARVVLGQSRYRSTKFDRVIAS